MYDNNRKQVIPSYISINKAEVISVCSDIPTYQDSKSYSEILFSQDLPIISVISNYLETLKGTDIKMLWKNGYNFKKIREYFETENKNSKCSHCAYVNACQGGCPSVRLATKTPIDPRCPLQKKTYLNEGS